MIWILVIAVLAVVGLVGYTIYSRRITCPECGKTGTKDVASCSPSGPNPLGISATRESYRCPCNKFLYNEYK